jgi:hypothetical protein
MKDKEFELKEAAGIIAKSMYKSVKKASKSAVKDVLDPNFKPEASPDQNPLPKTGVMYKKDNCLEPEHLESEMIDLKKPSKNSKLKQFLDKKKAKK